MLAYASGYHLKRSAQLVKLIRQGLAGAKLLKKDRIRFQF